MFNSPTHEAVLNIKSFLYHNEAIRRRKDKADEVRFGYCSTHY